MMEVEITPSSDPYPGAESSGNRLDTEASFRGQNSPVLGTNQVPAGNR